MHELVSPKQEILINLLVKILGDFRHQHKTTMQITFNCPTCAEIKGIAVDNKHNLEINYGKGMYNCWSCGSSHGTHGTVFDLIRRFGDRNDLEIYIALDMQYEYLFDDEDRIERKDDHLLLPVEFASLVGKEDFGVYRKAYSYLHQRGITAEIIEKFNLGWCYGGPYEDRILIPSLTDEGNWNFFVTRTMKKETKPKYLNCDLDKELIVFNESMINWDKTIFLVEGPFDHIVTPNSIPMLGKKLYPLLHSTLYDNAKSKIVVLVDPDAVETGMAIYRQLDGGKLMGKVFINFLPKYYDPAKFFERFGLEAYKQQLRLNKRLFD